MMSGWAILLLGALAVNVQAQSVLQPASAWTPEEQCAADVSRICGGSMVECRPCTKGTIQALADCKAQPTPTPCPTVTPCPDCPPPVVCPEPTPCPPADCSAPIAAANACKVELASWQGAARWYMTERDNCAVALQASLNKDKTQKACVTKTAAATARRCFP